MAAQTPSKSIGILTWNINRHSAMALDALGTLEEPLDVVALQEVTLAHSEAIQRRLSCLGFGRSIYTGDPDAPKKRYGNIIASRWPVRRRNMEPAAPALPWPQLVGHAVVATPAGPIHIITAHIPNGADNGWAKFDTLRALRGAVIRLRGQPLILAGDFNEPQFAMQDGRVVTWGQEKQPDKRYGCWTTWTYHGRTGTGEEWDAAVRWFFEHPEASGLRNAYWEVVGHGAMEPTHVSRELRRWFDHVFISDTFRVETCAYLHAVRKRGLSDHSALVARLAYWPPNNTLHRTRQSRAAERCR